MYSKEVERVGTFGKMEIKNFFHQIAKLNLRHCKYIRTSQQDQSVPLTTYASRDGCLVRKKRRKTAFNFQRGLSNWLVLTLVGALS